MYIAPKIIIFTSKFNENNEEYRNSDNFFIIMEELQFNLVK